MSEVSAVILLTTTVDTQLQTSK